MRISRNSAKIRQPPPVQLHTRVHNINTDLLHGTALAARKSPLKHSLQPLECPHPPIGHLILVTANSIDLKLNRHMYAAEPPKQPLSLLSQGQLVLLGLVH